MSDAFDIVTSGESHGAALTAIIRNVPAGFRVDPEQLNQDLAQRQKGYGRGDRMKIETDRAEILSGVRNGETTGAPLCIMIKNKDFENWKDKKTEPFTRPRPGHADLSGGMKYRRTDLRDVLERSSARETAIRLAAGALAKQFLKEFNIATASFVEVFGGIDCMVDCKTYPITKIQEITASNELKILVPENVEKIKKLIDTAKANGDTLGGIFVVIAEGVPPALGSFDIPANKLDANIAHAFMSLQAIKGVEFGLGRNYAYLPGSKVHDQIYYDEKNGFYRKTNFAGGIEGGMSNGQRIHVRAVMKPIPTLMQPLQSVDIKTKKAFEAVKERSDVTAVPAAAVIGEGLLAVEIFRAMMQRYGYDNRAMMLKHWAEDLRNFEWIES